MIFSQEDPSPRWNSEYFDDYKSDAFLLGDIQASKISGINKEGQFREIAVLAKIGDYYLQALPNGGEVSLEYFDRVISSLRFVDSDVAHATYMDGVVACGSYTWRVKSGNSAARILAMISTSNGRRSTHTRTRRPLPTLRRTTWGRHTLTGNPAYHSLTCSIPRAGTWSKSQSTHSISIPSGHGKQCWQ